MHDAVSTVAWEWLEGLDDLTHVSGSWCGPQIGTSAGLSTGSLSFPRICLRASS